MTTQPTLGAQQLAGSLHRGSTHDYLPQFQTWSSIDRELAPSLCIPPASKVLPSVARSAQQEDRASILDRIIAFCVAAIFGAIGAGSLTIGILYWLV